MPPYVPERDLALLPREARQHEPAHALLSGPHGLDHVRALVAHAAGWLAPGGQLLLELARDQVASADASARGRLARPGAAHG